jgi:tetratricopeptide (TPR) repeat protein
MSVSLPRLFTLIFVFAAFGLRLCAQGVVVSGTVCDADDHPLRDVEVSLEGKVLPQAIRSASDAEGHFQFATVPAGTYTVVAKRDGYQEMRQGLLEVTAARSIVLRMKKAEAATDAAASIPFSDEPQFTVAGITDTSELGIHSSSRSAPNSTAMAKDAASLARDEVKSGNPGATEAEIRAKLGTGENADLRFELAELEEKSGHALEAERDYQRAAELAPSEAHLFAWGAELLLHRAMEPSVEVFRKGHARYPQSVRMLLGLGASYYAEGSRDEAAQFFLQASDLDPSDERPYLFMGRLMTGEKTTQVGWGEKMRRFVELHPENAMAHYLYGLAIAQQGEGDAAAQYGKAIEIDPHLGDAYLQLGILQAQRKDFAGAVTALQKAVEWTALPDEAHYRLAEVYRRMGEAEKARQETALYEEIAARKAKDAERERHEVQQFVYTLKDSRKAE